MESFTLPRRLLPTQEDASHLLQRVFPDMDHRVDAGAEGWACCVKPGWRWMVIHDPELETHVQAWSGLNLEDAFAWHALDFFGGTLWLESFSHAWALLAWSHWLHAGPHTELPLIVHVDAHDDLGASALLEAGMPYRFAALLDETEMDLCEPDTVVRFLQRGLIGMGNYPIPFLRAVNGCDWVHVTPHGSVSFTRQFFIRAIPVGGGYSQLAVSPVEDEWTHVDDIATHFSYLRTTELASIDLPGPRSRPIFLDVDLDAFAMLPSRTGGMEVQAVSDLAQALDAVDLVGAAFLATGLAGRVAAVTIAYSPSFFPAAWMPAVVPRLRNWLRQVI